MKTLWPILAFISAMAQASASLEDTCLQKIASIPKNSYAKVSYSEKKIADLEGKLSNQFECSISSYVGVEFQLPGEFYSEYSKVCTKNAGRMEISSSASRPNRTGMLYRSLDLRCLGATTSF